MLKIKKLVFLFSKKDKKLFQSAPLYTTVYDDRKSTFEKLLFKDKSHYESDTEKGRYLSQNCAKYIMG